MDFESTDFQFIERDSNLYFECNIKCVNKSVLVKAGMIKEKLLLMLCMFVNHCVLASHKSNSRLINYQIPHEVVIIE